MPIVEITEPEQLPAAYAVLRELRTTLTEEEFLARWPVLRKAGSRMFALVEEDGCLAIACVVVRENYFDGRFLWVDDLVTIAAARSRGCGKRLLNFIEGFAVENGCSKIALASALHRPDAHRFYIDKCGCEQTSYLFKKAL